MNSEIEVHDKKPEGFASTIEAAAVYVNTKGKILILEIANGKSESGFWGVPAGKIDAGETAIAAAKREIFEETGIDIASEGQLESIGALYMCKPDIHYIYHMFGIRLDEIPDVILSPREHLSYQWVSRDELRNIPLMKGAMEALNHYYTAGNIY